MFSCGGKGNVLATSTETGHCQNFEPHSTDTAEKHYRALDRGKTILAYKSVGSILGTPVTEKPVAVSRSPKRRFYSGTETALVMESFKCHINRKVLPTKEEADSFLAIHMPNGLFKGRKSHDLYDKIRNITGCKNLKN